MMAESLIRFVVGGAVVSAFALIADILRPKSFAGLFGAAPSVALVSLALGTLLHGRDYVAALSVSISLVRLRYLRSASRLVIYSSKGNCRPCRRH